MVPGMIPPGPLGPGAAQNFGLCHFTAAPRFDQPWQRVRDRGCAGRGRSHGAGTGGHRGPPYGVTGKTSCNRGRAATEGHPPFVDHDARRARDPARRLKGRNPQRLPKNSETRREGQAPPLRDEWGNVPQRGTGGRRGPPLRRFLVMFQIGAQNRTPRLPFGKKGMAGLNYHKMYDNVPLLTSARHGWRCFLWQAITQSIFLSTNGSRTIR